MQVIRAGAIIAVSDLAKSLHFYRDQLGLAVDALYEDPPYATLVCAGARISLAQQGFTAPDRPGVVMTVPADPGLASVVLIMQVDDADAARELLGARGVAFLGPSSYPPWGGSRFFCVDPDGYLVEIESAALPGRSAQQAQVTRQAVLDLGHVIAGQVVHKFASDVTGVDDARVLDGRSVLDGRKVVVSDPFSSVEHLFSAKTPGGRVREGAVGCGDREPGAEPAGPYQGGGGGVVAGRLSVTSVPAAASSRTAARKPTSSPAPVRAGCCTENS